MPSVSPGILEAIEGLAGAAPDHGTDERRVDR
jgi:hypothetical protein